MPAFPRHLSLPRTRHAGFTLIELLTVIAVIGILAALTFGMVSGIKERSNLRRAEADLAALSDALERYKTQFGDYPRTGAAANDPLAESPSAADAPGILFNALTGKRGPTVNNITLEGRSFIDLDRFRLQDPSALPLEGKNQQPNAIVDPWNRRYVYAYNPPPGSAAWQNPSYVLYSVGSDGLHQFPPANGFPDFQHASNIDNIYANRN
jgi:prepilin-type N-terminal cleavage/methylation domain-containing protein